MQNFFEKYIMIHFSVGTGFVCFIFLKGENRFILPKRDRNDQKNKHMLLKELNGENQFLRLTLTINYNRTNVI